jgi:hypothetical protein
VLKNLFFQKIFGIFVFLSLNIIKMRQILIEKYVKPSETKMEGTFFAECWFNEYGDLHSFLGHPAFIYYKNGVLTKQCWYKKGEKHRDNDFPAIIQYYKEKKDRQYWYKKGIMQPDILPRINSWGSHAKTTRVLSNTVLF